MFRLLVFLTIAVFIFSMSVLSIAQLPRYWGLNAYGCVMGGLLGLRIGTQIEGPGGLGGYSPSDVQMIGCLLGAFVLGYVVPELIKSAIKPKPSPKLLHGRSPAYIESYIQAYQSETAALKGLP